MCPWHKNDLQMNIVQVKEAEESTYMYFIHMVIKSQNFMSLSVGFGKK